VKRLVDSLQQAARTHRFVLDSFDVCLCVLFSNRKTKQSIALPDGSHKVNEDYIFFMTKYNEETLYGVSCYRQVAASAKLKQTDASFTRSAVQKAVVCLCRLPLFGVVRSVLGAATHAYFNQENFGETEILFGIFRSMNLSLQRSDIAKEFHSYLYMGIDVRKMLLKFGRNTLCLFKLLLAGKKIVMYASCNIEAVCNELLALCSLVRTLILIV
jgi:hypothetical protein